MLCYSAVVIATAQLHLTESDFRFSTASNPDKFKQRTIDLRWWEPPATESGEIKAEKTLYLSVIS